MSRDDDRDHDDWKHEDEERDRDSYPRQKQSSHNKALIFFGGIGCVIVLGCGGLLVFVGIKGFSALATKAPPSKHGGQPISRPPATKPTR
jgi:hypothetical protein